MANKSKAEIDGTQITGDWAREETLSDILAMLEKTYGKSGKKKTTTREKDVDKKRETQSKLFKSANKGLTEWINKNKSNIKQVNSSIKTNKYVNEGINILGDTTHLAGKTINRFGSSTRTAVEELDKLDGSVQGANDAFFKVVGGAGALGTVFGVVAGIIDQFAEFQTQAIQTGFSFSQELVNTRGNIAGVGMNMKQLSDILASNGEAVRSLGGNSAQSANSFIDLISEVKAANRQFGLFGMTSEEIAGVTAERLDLMRRQGFVEDQAYNATVDSFQLLNHEVLAYSKLTGRDRREIQRNNLAMREGTELLLADLSKLGPNATVSFDSMTNGMSAIFGSSGDEFAGIFSSMVESHFMGGMERLSGDQLGALIHIPGLREIFEEARDQFIRNADNPAAMKDISLNFATDSAEAIQQAMDKGLVSQARLQEDSPVGDLLRSVIGARQQANNFLNRTADEIEEAFSGDMDRGEAELLMIRERIQTLQNEFQAMLVSAFTFGGTPADLLNEDNFKSAQETIANFGESIKGVMEFLSGLGSLVLPDGTGDISAAFIGGIGAMFAVQGAVTLAMVAGARLAMGAAAAMFNPVTLAAIVGAWFATGGAMDSVNNTVNGWLNDTLGTNFKTDYDMAGWWDRYMAGETTFWTDTPITPTGSNASTESPKIPTGGNTSTESSPSASMMMGNPTKAQSTLPPVRTPPPQFQDLDMETQSNLRMQTPRGELDQRLETGGIDKETHAILTGRTFERMEALIIRQTEAVEKMRRDFADNQN